MYKNFDEILEDVTKLGTKINMDEYHPSGRHRIIDQGQDSIAGYTDLEDGLFEDVPAIVFGDHTRIVKYVDQPFFLGADGVKVLRSRFKDANYRYLYYALKYVKIPNTGYNRHFKWLKTAQIKLPNTETQSYIVSALDSVSKIIEYRQQQLQKLDELVKARFVEMFGDPFMNEKGWPIATVADYYEVKGGKRIPKGMGYSSTPTMHPYLRATDMKNETILDNDIHYIDDEVFEKIKRYTVESGDIYLTNVGVNLGMAGVIPDKFDGANLTENAVKLVPKKEGLNSKYLAHYINTDGIQNYINERKMAVGVPKLAIFRIETMPLLIPDKKYQDAFVEFMECVDKSKLLEARQAGFIVKSRSTNISFCR